ncbi:MAG: bifunctional diaminohydroxyphosphoribosylaminopyrimidine deaminase/5-amino-6-(5-phosphoribosylamino)uracil reductase RibD [Candidatus Omnitrophica bacterium]|nr:bifunctional diaminohydroxyphosphoribosylaminopyrimidine deaminase/5-amino-6-(5-phosphoribosylamino)uracil reductase RibD [Candidatus Omnitrophota bacterium]
MKRCLSLAKRAEGFTNPNPMVGAVIVKNNKIISEGYHKRAGEKHAEIVAIEKAKGNLKSATLYVNLEPCSSFGRTPPCTEKIIKSGIKKVVIAMSDPNPAHNGKGIEILRKAGIEVIEGILKPEAEDLNRVFIKHITKKIPYITVKSAITLDGRISDYTGNSKWITSEGLRFYFHKELRSKVDAIVVGINTVLKDNPLLSARRSDGSYYKKQPAKIILDSKFRIPKDARLFREIKSDVILVVGDNVTRTRKEKFLEARGVKILPQPLKNGKINLPRLIKDLYKLGICHLLVEGGGKVISSFLKEKLADEIYLAYAPLIIGGENLFYCGKEMKLSRGIRVKDVSFKKFDNQIIIKGKLNYVYRNNKIPG